MVIMHIQGNKKISSLMTTNRFLARNRVKDFKGYSCDLYIKDIYGKKETIMISVGYIKEDISLVNALDIADYYMAMKGIKDWEYNIYIREWGIL